MKQSIHPHAKAPTLKRVIRKPAAGATNVGAGLPAIFRGNTPGWVSSGLPRVIGSAHMEAIRRIEQVRGNSLTMVLAMQGRTEIPCGTN